MAVRCAQCGEELMGAVNRCWRCGKPLVPQADADRVPPVRRSPLPAEVVLGTAIKAECAEVPIVAEDVAAEDVAANGGRAGSAPADSAEAGPGRSDERAAARLPDGPQREGSGSSGQATRRGSPFAPSGGELTARRGPRAGSAPAGGGQAATGGSGLTPPVYPRNAAAVGGAFAALVLGLMSLLASFYTNAALITGLLGLGMGIWGLYSTRRVLALVGIAVCLLALLISGFHGAVDWYTYVYGRSPFEADVPEALDPAEWDGEASPW